MSMQTDIERYLTVGSASGLKATTTKHYRYALMDVALPVLLQRGCMRAADVQADDLEAVVKDEEDKLTSELKSKGIYALIAALGLRFGV